MLRTCRVDQKPVFAVDKIQLGFQCDVELFSRIEQVRQQLIQELGCEFSRSKTIKLLLDQGLELIETKYAKCGELIHFDLSDTNPSGSIQ